MTRSTNRTIGRNSRKLPSGLTEMISASPGRPWSRISEVSTGFGPFDNRQTARGTITAASTNGSSTNSTTSACVWDRPNKDPTRANRAGPMPERVGPPSRQPASARPTCCHGRFLVTETSAPRRLEPAAPAAI